MSHIIYFASFAMVCRDSKIVSFIQHTTFVNNEHSGG